MAVLKGDENSLNLTEGSNSTKRVLKSDEKSSVFLYFSDHGAPGFLLLPNDSVYADELNETISYMFEKKMYNEFVIFLEACESGSIFKHFDLSVMNAYALTATNETNPSFGTYCYPHDVVKDEHLYTCLGDLFSVNWMQYIEDNSIKLS